MVEPLVGPAQSDRPAQRLRMIVERCVMPGMLLEFRTEFERPFLRVSSVVVDPTQPSTIPRTRQYGRWFRLSPWMTDGEVVQTALMAVLHFCEHEVREHFKVDGLPVFQPHWDLEFLLRAARDRANTREREDDR